MSVLAILALAGLMLILAAMLVFAAGSVYQNIELQAQENDTLRIMRGYLTNQLRSYDYEGGITCDTYADGAALCLGEGDYVTWIYCYEGTLREFYVDIFMDEEPEMGAIVGAAESLRFDGGDVILTLADGSECRVPLSVRGAWAA